MVLIILLFRTGTKLARKKTTTSSAQESPSGIRQANTTSNTFGDGGKSLYFNHFSVQIF